MTAKLCHYQFMAEPITALAGQLLAVEIKTQMECEGMQVLYPALVIKTWSAEAKRNYLYEQLSAIVKQAKWILKRGILVSLPLYDEESALLFSHDTALRYALGSLPFVKLELPEAISTVRSELRGITNGMWLGDLGKGDDNVSGLVTHAYEGVKLDTLFFNNEVVKPTFTMLIENLRHYCDRIIVPCLKDKRHMPLLQEAGIWGIQGLYRSVPFTKVHTLM